MKFSHNCYTPYNDLPAHMRK